MRCFAIFFLLRLVPGAQAGPVVKLQNGEVEGTTVGDVGLWRGIPFAKPPVGDLRWRPPQSPEPWSTRLMANEFRHNCLQSVGTGMGWFQPLSTMSEDCLYLNVYAPVNQSKAKKPVMLWIYGGGFQGGGGNETRLNGTWDVALTKGEVVVVTFNYRLNVFGFLAHDDLRSRDPEGSTGNYGIQDQRMAMKWVQENIAAFGGDSSRVFIVGQSAGAKSVSNHLVRNKSWGLFSSAGLESGAFYNGAESSVQDMKDKYSALLRETRCAGVDCLLGLAADKLSQLGNARGWSPVMDGVDLVDSGVSLAARGHLAPVPILLGSVMEDIPSGPSIKCNPTKCSETDFRAYAKSWGFNSSQVDRMTKLYSDEAARPGGQNTKWYWAARHAGADVWATCPARRLARWSSAIGQDAYLYYWTYPPKGFNGRYPKLAHHACEQPFVFHVLSESPAENAEDHGAYHIQGEDEKEFSAAVVRYWVSFATSGEPSADGKVTWPKYDGQKQNVLKIGGLDDSVAATTFALSPGSRSGKCDFWDDHESVHFDDAEPPSSTSSIVI